MRFKKIFPLAIVAFLIISAYLFGKFQTAKTSNSPQRSTSNKTLKDWEAKEGEKVFSYCKREESYPIKPEFRRAIDRMGQAFSDVKKDAAFQIILANYRCLDISYASTKSEMSGADGLFYFSKEVSGPERLKILVDSTFQAQDDIVNSVLLVHELIHAQQFILREVLSETISQCYKEVEQSLCDELRSENSPVLNMSCSDMEVDAFYGQLIFFVRLKPVERDTFLLRANQGYYNNLHLPVLQQALLWDDVMLKCPVEPGDSGTKWTKCTKDYFRKVIEESSFYKDQCGIN